jgi:phage/plasmid primase-like uncharacterized protein
MDHVVARCMLLCSDVRRLWASIRSVQSSDPVRNALVWSKLLQHKDLAALQAHASALQPPQTVQDQLKAELASVVFDTLQESMQHLIYRQGQDSEAMQAKNITLATVINLEKLRRGRLVAPLAKLLGVSRATIVKAGERRGADLGSKNWVRWTR